MKMRESVSAFGRFTRAMIHQGPRAAVPPGMTKRSLVFSCLECQDDTGFRVRDIFVGGFDERQ